MIGRQLVQALARTPPPPQRVRQLPHTLTDTAPPHPLRACPCDVDLAVFGHTQCQEAPVPWPRDPQAHPH